MSDVKTKQDLEQEELYFQCEALALNDLLESILMDEARALNLIEKLQWSVKSLETRRKRTEVSRDHARAEVDRLHAELIKPRAKGRKLTPGQFSALRQFLIGTANLASLGLRQQKLDPEKVDFAHLLKCLPDMDSFHRCTLCLSWSRSSGPYCFRCEKEREVK